MRLGFVAFVVLAACSSNTPGQGTTGRANGSECSHATHCSSETCLLLRDNKQRKTGMCTKECTTDASCGQGFLCLSTNLGGYCMPACNTTFDCKDGFICVPGRGNQKVCGVDPVNGGTTDPDGCTTEVFGSCIMRAAGQCVEKGGVEADALEADKKACEADPSNIWSDGPCPLLDLVGGCRQGCDRPTTTWYYASSAHTTIEAVEKVCTEKGQKLVKP